MRLLAVLLLVVHAAAASAEVVRVEIRRRDDAGTHERLIGRVYFAVDPDLPANRGIADLSLAPRNASGKVEFSSDLLFFQPKDTRRANGTIFLEVVNRGRDQSLAIMSAARQRDLAPENWDLGDRFALEQGFTVAFLGWQFDVDPSQGLTFQAPVAPVDGLVRASYIESGDGPRYSGFRLPYCAAEASRADARLTVRSGMEDTPRTLPREAWTFGNNGCSVVLAAGFDAGLYEAIYRASGSPVAGLGLAAVRDFASYLKNGPRDSARDGSPRAPLRENPALVQRVIGYGYSQSGRFLREFVRDGFNADERGRPAFDGLLIASAGAGGGSFNHRFAMPGQAGNSVLSVLRPVDLPPFTDDGLLARARTANVTPKIFYTFSSTEYWARAGSLTHTNEQGTADVPLAPTSRLYFLTGTPHASGPLSLSRGGNQQFKQFLNFAEQRWVQRALLLDLDAWIRSNTEPPSSRYPAIARGELVPLENVRFPRVPAFPFAAYMPRVWRMDYGPQYATAKVITNEPPAVGEPYRVLVPQVNADGNDIGGIALPEVAVPLGTHTGWNIAIPPLAPLRYLAGLLGSFEPFAQTRADRESTGDSRLSIGERYSGKRDYLDRVGRAVNDLVKERFMLAADVPAAVRRGEQMWATVVGNGTR
jgi:hypothetical protein